MRCAVVEASLLAALLLCASTSLVSLAVHLVHASLSRWLWLLRSSTFLAVTAAVTSWTPTEPLWAVAMLVSLSAAVLLCARV